MRDAAHTTGGADLCHLAWLVRQTPGMICRVSKIHHHCDQPVMPQSWGNLWAIQMQELNPIRSMDMMAYKTVPKNICWQPNRSPFSHFHKNDYNDEMNLPPRLFSAWHYSIAVPKDENGITYEFIRMHQNEKPVFYGYCDMVWGTPRLGWKKAPEWPAVALALTSPDGFERVYDCKAEEVARLAVRKEDEMFDLMQNFCRIA